MCHNCEYIVVSFDESLNKKAQKGQMDIFVPFWDSKIESVRDIIFTPWSHCLKKLFKIEFCTRSLGTRIYPPPTGASTI